MSDKPNQNSNGDESSKQDPRLSDTWVPENDKKPAPKSQDPIVDQTIAGPPSNEPTEFDGDMTFVAPPAMSEADSGPSDESSEDMNVTFVGNVEESGEPEDSSSKNLGDDAMATFVGSMDSASEDTDDVSEQIVSSDLKFVPSAEDESLTFVPEASEDADSDVGDETEFSATVVGMSSDEGNANEDADEVDDDPNNFATIVPSGDKERGTDGDPFTATIVGQVPDTAGADVDRDENRTADLPPRPSKAAREANPNLTQGANGDRTLQKTTPQRRRDDKPQPKSAPAVADMDATFVSDSSDGVERPREKMDQTAGLSGSGSGGPGGSSGGSQGAYNIKSNIWTNPNTTSLDELISMRCRHVSGTGQFASADGSEAADADFEIIEKLAEGGMGVVYVAKQKSLNRELAIKTLKGSGGSTLATMRKSSSGKQMSRAERQKREMFLSEALVTANLVHPNIIPIHELAETADGMPYYVMKRVHGIPWNKRVREMSLQENLDVLHKACDAIAYAHHHGVINRDLKPENIMLGEFGEVLVLDWGLAVPAPHAAEQNFRSPVASFGAGTPAYMSPELWTGPPEAIGECSDIYLLGAILFEIVTGDPPHEFTKVESKAARSDLWQTIDKVLRINKIRETSESGELLDIAFKAMRTNPDERFGSVLEFQFAVRNYQRHEESRRLSVRAAELVGENATTKSLGEYHTYQTASALFEESLRTWPQNTLARNGLRSTRLRYAQLANQKGDYDLGLQVTAQEANDAEFQSLEKKLSQAKTIRSSIKWTAVAAMMLVVALGAKSIYDNGIITNLNAEVTTRKAEATKAIADADEAKSAATIAKAQADTAATQANQAKTEAVVALKEADDARIAAAKSNEQALVARDEATKAQDAAAKSKMEANMAIAQAEEASKKVAEANVQLATAEKSAAEAIQRREKAETDALVAQVEIQSQSIRGLTLSQNYSDALRELDRLLDGEVLPKLPETVREQRTTELRAQREQLLKRTRRADAPIQTQATSADGSKLALGDISGTVSVLTNPGSSMNWSDVQKTLKLAHPISRIRFIDDSTLVIAAGHSLHFWAIDQPNAIEVTGHNDTIHGLDSQGDQLISGDASGRIVLWNTKTRTVMADMVAKTSIRDIAWIPGTQDFLYAGTRGGQSADVLAYRVEASESPEVRFDRLGQLRLSRDHNDAPSRLSVSPDGELLVISNSQNGQFLMLKRRSNAGSNEEFPFEQPADLARDGIMTWLATGHSRPVNGLEWSRDGKKLLTASDDRSIGVWTRSDSIGNAPALKRTMQLGGHGARVTQATFLDANATRVTSSSTDGFSRLWDLTTYDQDSREIRNAFQLSHSAGRRTENLVAEFVRIPRGFNAKTPSSHELGYKRHRYQFTSLPNDDSTETDEANDDESHTLNGESEVHRTPVKAIQFSDDGSTLVSGAADGTIAVWNTKTRTPVRSSSASIAAEAFREGHEFNVSRMKIVSTMVAETLEQILITSGYDGSLRLWNMNTASGRLGLQQQVISGVGLVNAFAASKDGQILVTTVAESTSERAGNCHVWMMEDLLKKTQPAPVMTLAGVHRAEVTAIAVSGDHRHIATGSREGVIAIWDAITGNALATSRAHAKNTSVTALEWLQDGSLMSGGLDGQLCRWQLDSTTSDDASPEKRRLLKRMVRYERGKTPIEQIAVSPDEKTVLVISVETNRREKTTTHHVHAWPVLNSIPDQALGERQGVSPPSTILDVRKLGELMPCRSPIHSEDSTEVMLAKVQSKLVSSVSSAQWSPDGLQVLVSTDLGVQLFDTSTWKVTRVFTPGNSSATDAQFVPTSAPNADGTNAPLFATFDGTSASLWNSSTGDRISWFRGPFPVSSVAMSAGSPDSLVLAGGASLRIFSGNTEDQSFGRPMFHVQKAHQGLMISLVAAPAGTLAANGRLFISGGTDGLLKLWQWKSESQQVEFLRDVADLKSTITSTKWCGDGSRILAVTETGRVALIDVTQADDGSVQFVVASESSAPAEVDVKLASCDISRDGKQVVIAGQIARTSESIGWVMEIKREPAQQNSIRVEARCTFSGHGAGGISSVSFADDSPYLISGGSDGSLILWNWQQPLPGATPVAYEAYRFLNSTSTTAHTGAITAIDFNPLTNTVASASEDTTITLWPMNLFVEARESQTAE